MMKALKNPNKGSSPIFTPKRFNLYGQRRRKRSPDAKFTSGTNPNSLPGHYNHQYPPPLPAPYDVHHQLDQNKGVGDGSYPCVPYVQHNKAKTIRNDVNVRKESVRVEKDEADPGKYLVAFNFDASVSGSITLIFFAKEGDESQLKPMKESILPPIIIPFEAGLGQKFRQPSGTGIQLSILQESELLKEGTYPLAIKAETRPPQESTFNVEDSAINSQITHAVFDNEEGEYYVKVVKQFLWVNETRYELQDIYHGNGNSAEGETDVYDPAKKCVICSSEPRDTTVLPCRHMCMCGGCAKVLRFQINQCPVCKQQIERLLEMEVGGVYNHIDGV